MVGHTLRDSSSHAARKKAGRVVAQHVASGRSSLHFSLAKSVRRRNIEKTLDLKHCTVVRPRPLCVAGGGASQGTRGLSGGVGAHKHMLLRARANARLRTLSVVSFGRRLCEGRLWQRAFSYVKATEQLLASRPEEVPPGRHCGDLRSSTRVIGKLSRS